MLGSPAHSTHPRFQILIRRIYYATGRGMFFCSRTFYLGAETIENGADRAGRRGIADLEGKQRSRVDEKRAKIRRRREASLFCEIATDQKRASKIAIFTG